MATREELEQIVQLHHICLELTGVISEFRSMPCSSLEQRMFGTVDRYSRRMQENAPTHEQREQLRDIHQKEYEDEQSQASSNV